MAREVFGVGFLRVSSLRVKGCIGNCEVLSSRHCVLRQVIRVVGRGGPSTLLVTKSVCSGSLPSTRTIRLFSHFVARVTKLRNGAKLGAFMVDNGRSSPREVNCFGGLVRLGKVFASNIFRNITEGGAIRYSKRGIGVFSLPFVHPSFMHGTCPRRSTGVASCAATIEIIFRRSSVGTSRAGVLVTRRFMANDRASNSRSDLNALSGIRPCIFRPFSCITLNRVRNGRVVNGGGGVTCYNSPVGCSGARYHGGGYIVFNRLSGKGLGLRRVPMRPLRSVEVVGKALHRLTRGPVSSACSSGASSCIFTRLASRGPIAGTFSALRGVCPGVVKLRCIGEGGDVRVAPRVCNGARNGDGVRLFSSFCGVRGKGRVRPRSMGVVREVFGRVKNMGSRASWARGRYFQAMYQY